MKVETLRDVLHWTTEFHQHLSSCLQYCADKNESEREKMLLAYLAKHESELASVVNNFEKTANINGLNTWCYEFMDKHPIVQYRHGNVPFSGLSATDIMTVIVDQHQQIIDLYRHLLSQVDISSAKELLESVKSLEEREAMKVSQGVNRLSDL